jgi:GNAT superfamily N-acetyltransferase
MTVNIEKDTRMPVIKKIDKNELLKAFYDILAEVEFGNHFDKQNEQHVKILNDRIEHGLSKGAVFFGMFEDNKTDPIGFITVLKNFHLFHRNDCEILEIGVNQKYQRQGYGSRLLKHVESYYKDDDLHCIFVKTYAADYKVIYFYGKNRYVPVSVIPDTNGPGDEGTIIMRKILNTKNNTSSNCI